MKLTILILLNLLFCTHLSSRDAINISKINIKCIGKPEIFYDYSDSVFDKPLSIFLILNKDYPYIIIRKVDHHFVNWYRGPKSKIIGDDNTNSYFLIYPKYCEDCDTTMEGNIFLNFLKKTNRFLFFNKKWYPVITTGYDDSFYLLKDNINDLQFQSDKIYKFDYDFSFILVKEGERSYIIYPI